MRESSPLKTASPISIILLITIIQFVYNPNLGNRYLLSNSVGESANQWNFQAKWIARCNLNKIVKIW
jgi:hypothetical protein